MYVYVEPKAIIADDDDVEMIPLCIIGWIFRSVVIVNASNGAKCVSWIAKKARLAK